MASQQSTAQQSTAVENAQMDLERDTFMRSLLHHLSGTLQDVVGLEEASGFVNIVARQVGDEIDQQYRRALHVDRLSRDQLGPVLVDLKRRIEGEFFIIEEDEEKIVLGNKACPFGDRVLGRPALCMMTTTVFGTIAANNLNYARVRTEQTIAEGAESCRVVIYLRPPGESNGHSGGNGHAHENGNGNGNGNGDGDLREMEFYRGIGST